ncbi:hypothetical protein ACQCT6_06220 [Cytobacillus gottheilii]|uniref:hypothetical protein n=1 Tax=Cytobacillus gottheilii TaxID=859144 RepID=UPI000832200A|nr:hypothetical protein [Cytobacillus gottheilii]
MTSILLILGFTMLAGAGYCFLLIKKPGMYPPKYLLKKRAATLGAGGGLLLLLGIVTLFF